MAGTLDAVAALIGVPAPDPFVYPEKSGAVPQERFRFAELDGVINDIAVFESILAERFGAYPNTELVPFLSRDETRVLDLKTSLIALIESVRPGGLFVMVMSGHGFQVPDLDGDETTSADTPHPESDRFDEAFAASDGPLLDDFFRPLWGANEHIRIVTIIDACSSDGLARGVLPVDYGIKDVTPSLHFHAEKPSRLFISAAMSWQAALQANGCDGAVSQGLLSGAMKLAWDRRPSTYTDWFDGARACITRQNPRLRYYGPDLDLLLEPPLRVKDAS